MAKLKQSLMVDGKKLSNKDPNLVITLEPNPAVYIKEIGEDTITYGFNGFPEVDTTYTLNLTFTYMGLISYEVPLNIVQRALAEEPMIVDVKPITVEVDSAYQAPFRVILPVSGRELTSGFAIDSIVDNAGTHTSYLAKTNNMMFTVITADDDDISGVFKFTVSGTHAGKVYTLSADVPVTIKKWSKPDYSVKVQGGNDTPIISSLNKTGEFTYSLYKRNILVPNTEYVTDVALLNAPGTGLSDATDSAVDADSRKVSMTFIEVSNGGKTFTVNDNNGVKLVTFTVLCLVDSGKGLSIRFPNDNERLLTGNVGDTILISPVITLDGTVIANSDPGLSLVTEKSVSDESPIPNLTIVGKEGTGWNIKINTPVVSDVSFLWVGKYTSDTGTGARIAGGLTVYTTTASKIQLTLLDDPKPNVAQSLRLKLEQPTYGAGPNWTVKGAKVDKLVGKLIDVATNTQVGSDFTLGSRIADQTGVVQIDLPRTPYQETRFEISGNVSPKWGKNGEGLGYASVPGVFDPVTIGSVPLVTTPVDNKVNYFNNSVTKVIFKLTQEQGDVEAPINAVEITEIAVTGKGFSTDTKAVKEAEDGTYSFNVSGMGEQGDIDVAMKVQYPVGKFHSTSMKLKAVKVLPVIVDNPISVQMWAYGDNPPFKVMLGAADVTNQITELKIGTNQYVVPDPSPGTTKKLWHVLYAESIPTPTKVPFTFKLSVDGVVEQYNGEGTFNLPAWDGVAAKVGPGGINNANFSGGKVKIGSSLSCNLLLNFKGIGLGDADKIVLLNEQSELFGGNAVTTGPGHWAEGKSFTITPKELGKQKYKLAIGPSSNISNGYPLTEGLGFGFWEPEIEVWDDVLSLTPKTQTVEATEMKNVEIPLAVKWNDMDLPLETTGIVVTCDNPLFVYQNFTTTGVVYKVNKEILVPEVQKGVITVTYGGKTETSEFTANIIVDQFKQLKIVDKPISAKIWDSGTGIPFQLLDDGVDITDQVIDLDFTPTPYVIKNPEGEGWYIDSAETVARDVKVMYSFKLEKNGSVVPFEYEATFKLAAWDGISIRTAFVKDNIMGLSTQKDTYFEITVSYKGVPAADKLELLDRGTLTFGNVTSLVPSEDNKVLRVNMRATTAGMSTSANITFKVKGTTENVINKTTSTPGLQQFYSMGDELRSVGQPGNVTGPTNDVLLGMNTIGPGGTTSKGYLFKNGDRLSWGDPDVEYYLSEGTSTSAEGTQVAANIIGGTETNIIYKITKVRGAGKGWHNQWRVRLKSNPTKYSLMPSVPESNFWVHPNGKFVNKQITLQLLDPINPSSNNDIRVKLKDVDNTYYKDATVTIREVYKTPSNGNVVIDGKEITITATEDPEIYLLKLSTGETGTSVRLMGLVRTPQAFYQLDQSLTVDQTPVGYVLNADSYTADEAHQVTIKFKLNQKRYGLETPYEFPNGALSGITVTGGTNVGLLAQDEDGYYGVVVELVTSGNVEIKGTITDEGNWKYPFTVTAPVIREYNLTVTDAPIDVNVWDSGTTPPFKVMEGTVDLTPKVTNLKVVPNDNVIQKDAGWLITAAAEMEAKSVLTEFTYQLEGDSVVRNASGTFNIAKYDGAEFTLKVVNPSTERGDITVPAGGTARVNISGWYKGEIITGNPGFGVKEILVAGNIKSIGAVNMMGDKKIFDCPMEPGNSVAVENIVSFSRTGATGNVEGVDYAVLTIPITAYTAGNVDVNQKETEITGSFGDEVEIHADMRYSNVVLTLDNSTTNNNGVVSVVVNDNTAIELIPESITPMSFKVRFKQSFGEDVTVPVTISYSLKIGSDPAKTVTRPLTVIHKGTTPPLVLNDNFDTSGSGDEFNPATLTQSVVSTNE